MQSLAEELTDISVASTDNARVEGALASPRPSRVPAAASWPGKLSLCLPAYNEQDCIVETLGRALALLPSLVASLEVIVVDDGSQDATAEHVRSVMARDGRVRLVVHGQNRGYGAAVTSGLSAATGDLVMFADSDGQFDFRDVARLLERLPGNDFVVGYRHRRAESFRRRLNAWAWGRLVRLVYGVRARDLDCAFKIFRRAVIGRLHLTASGACINAELMCQCLRAGFRFAEVPVEHYLRKGGRPTGSSLKVIARAFRELPWIQTQPWPAPPPASRPDHLSLAA
ncbi:MAG TPA: glycosyltransferase family 2 protein [Pirellulales bacterium]|nr:glycosyltransferase family 2 protein [Pirellulales bacterium]